MPRDDDNDRSGRRRAETPAEVRLDELRDRLDRDTRERLEDHSDRLRLGEMARATFIGTAETPGVILRIEETVKQLGRDMEDIKLFKQRIMWGIGLAASSGGVIAALAWKLIDHFMR